MAELKTKEGELPTADMARYGALRQSSPTDPSW